MEKIRLVDRLDVVRGAAATIVIAGLVPIQVSGLGAPVGKVVAVCILIGLLAYVWLNTVRLHVTLLGCNSGLIVRSFGRDCAIIPWEEAQLALARSSFGRRSILLMQRSEPILEIPFREARYQRLEAVLHKQNVEPQSEEAKEARAPE